VVISGFLNIYPVEHLYVVRSPNNLVNMSSHMRTFETPRTRKFRASHLSQEEERTIGHIEDFGCSVVSVTRTKYGHGWSYTVGVFDTCGKPEIITVGLPPKTAHFALNEAAKLLRNDIDLTKGRHRDLVGKVECEFRSVDRKWIARLMGWAAWYYDGADVPALQVVYPDRENRFPEENGFDRAFEQPLLQPDAPMTAAENDFWVSTDPASSLFDWKFSDPPHTSVFLSETVHKELNQSHTSHTKLRMARGNSWATACPTAVVPSSPASTTQSTATLVWLN
jgi:hypothetical protein